MANVFIVANHQSGSLSKTSAELIRLSAAAGCKTHVILMGRMGDALFDACGKQGADTVFYLPGLDPEKDSVARCAQAIAKILKKKSVHVVLGEYFAKNNELLAYLANDLDAGLALGCTDLNFDGSALTARTRCFAGKFIADVKFNGDGCQLATARANCLNVEPQTLSRTPTLEVLNTPDNKTSEQLVQYLETIAPDDGRRDISETPVVVTGGRALNSRENFTLLEKLAEKIDASVGASRAAVDAGWRHHQDQVGQTGKTVSPHLYIACGVSGASHHVAGMNRSGCIIAINSDPNAPIFGLSNYKIVADLFEIIPKLTDALNPRPSTE